MATKKNHQRPSAPDCTVSSGTGPADPERLRARLELRRSAAASRHVSARRKGSRQANQRRAIAAAW